MNGTPLEFWVEDTCTTEEALSRARMIHKSETFEEAVARAKTLPPFVDRSWEKESEPGPQQKNRMRIRMYVEGYDVNLNGLGEVRWIERTTTRMIWRSKRSQKYGSGIKARKPNPLVRRIIRLAQDQFRKDFGAKT